MKIESFKNLSQPSVIEASRVVIRDSTTNNPVCCIIEFEPGQFWITTQADKEFNKALSLLRINDTVVVDRVTAENNPQAIQLPKG